MATKVLGIDHAYLKGELRFIKGGPLAFLVMLGELLAQRVDREGGIRPYSYSSRHCGHGSYIFTVEELAAIAANTRSVRNTPQTSDKQKPPAVKPGAKPKRRKKRRVVRKQTKTA